MLDNAAAIQFIDKLLEEKGVSDMSESARLTLRNDLLRRLEQKIMRAVVDSLNEEQLKGLNDLLDSNQLDRLDSYLQEAGINKHVIVARCMVDLQVNYLGLDKD